MEVQLDRNQVQTLLTNIKEQRNRALDELADMKTYAKLLEQRIHELEEGSDNDEV